MTKEDAINLLKQVNEILVNNNSWLENTHEPLNQAFDMAIKSLEQQPTEDCVSREQAVKAMTDWYIDMLENGEGKDFINILDALPPVTPTRKQGEWCEQNDDYFNWYECSECGYGSEGEMQYSSECDVRTKYCPNCGAEMRGAE